MLAVTVGSFHIHVNANGQKSGSLLGHCSLNFGAGELAVHGVKLVRHADPARPGHTKLGLFFPAHTAWVHCTRCGCRGEERDNFCAGCGVRLRMPDAPPPHHFDWVHPLTTELRSAATEAVLAAWRITQSQPAPAAESGDGLTG